MGVSSDSTTSLLEFPDVFQATASETKAKRSRRKSLQGQGQKNVLELSVDEDSLRTSYGVQMLDLD